MRRRAARLRYLLDTDIVIYLMHRRSAAVAANLTLVTNHVREFARVPDLKVENWV